MACCSPTPQPAPTTGVVTTLPGSLVEHAAKTLAFDCPDRVVNAGFHITEIKRASIASLDCGRARDSWQEIIIQVMDVPGSSDSPLTAGKFGAIVAEALGKTDPAGAAITVELSDGTDALRLYDVAAAHARDEAFVIRLHPRAARCKAAGRMPERASSPEAASRCCG